MILLQQVGTPGDGTGYVSVNANTEFNVEAGNVVFNSDDNFAVQSEKMNTNTNWKM